MDSQLQSRRNDLMDIPHRFRPQSFWLLFRLFPLYSASRQQIPVKLLQIQGSQLRQRDLSNGRIDVVFDNAHVRCVGAGPHFDGCVVLVPHTHPLTQCVLPGLDHVQAFCFVNGLVEFFHHFRLGLAQDVPVDGLAFWGVACRVAAFPPAIFPFPDISFAVGSSFRHVDRLLSQLPTLPDMCYLCPAVCFESGREKLPHLLVDLHHLWAGSSFTGLFFV